MTIAQLDIQDALQQAEAQGLIEFLYQSPESRCRSGRRSYRR
jgi:hypothetical protein